MTSDARERHETLDHLVDEHSRTGMSRQFLQRAMAAGLTAASASMLLAACVYTR
jgi:hypothetical protein